jgi:hypothetical protein
MLSSVSIRDLKDRRPNSPSEDMAILQVIENYYFTGKKNQPKNEMPQIQLLDDELSNMNVNEISGSVDGLDEKSISSTVFALTEEIRQMRGEIDSLANCLRKEKKARKRLKHFVENLTLDAEELT